jgi:nucleoid-associated protein YgaU
MKLAQLNIQPLEPSELAATFRDGIDVLFNPTTYSIAKPVHWAEQSAADGLGGTSRDLDAPPLVFGGGGARVLTLELFFDVTEGGAEGTTFDVRDETNKIVALTRIGRNRAQPPVCRVSWGKAPDGSDFPFDGVVTSLSQTFVLFRGTGEPLRANLAVVFTEFIDPEQNKKKTDPDLTTYLVKRGDTLSSIAAKLYRDPALWRPIAEANGIDDPRGLTIGARLSVPRIA